MTVVRLGLVAALFLFVCDGRAAGVDGAHQSIVISIGTEPPSLDSSIAEDGVSRGVLNAINEGLVRLDQRLNPIPAVAERWERNGTTVTFYLRPEARWEDTSPVTAHDFVYAWRRLVDPATGASGSTVSVYTIMNGSEILKGELPPEKLGVVALDEYTLRVTLTGPVPTFLEIVSTAPYFPLRQSFVEAQGDRFAAEARQLLANGPFRLIEWTHGASLRLERNPTYWNNVRTRLNEIDIAYVTPDTRTLMNLFTGGELATFDLDGPVLKDAAEAGIRLRQNPTTGCIGIVTFNHRSGRPTANLHVRRAVRAVFDPETFVNRVMQIPAHKPAWTVFHSVLMASGEPFHDAYPAPRVEADAAAGRRHLAQASSELGVLPVLTLLSNEGQEKETEYVQGLLKSTLGIDVKVDRQTFKQAIQKLISGDFDLAFSRFCSPSRDPDFFAGIFHSEDNFNDGRFSNPEYDRLLGLTRKSFDAKARMEAFSAMQQILFDDVAILPTHELGQVYAQDERLRGVQRFPARSFVRAAVR